MLGEAEIFHIPGASATSAQDALKKAGIVFLVILMYGGVSLGLWRASARGPDAFVVVPQAIESERQPRWLPAAEVERINSLGKAVRGRSLLDPDLPTDLAACYMESPWVARVSYVRRAYPNKLLVELVLRRPVAAVDSPSGPPVVLDKEGVRLPVSANPEGLVRLTGVGSNPPPPGKLWSDVRVTDGLRVLERYKRLLASDGRLGPSFSPVEVRVGNWSRPSSRPSVEILTQSGVLIRWGVDLPSGEATVTGPSADEKLAKLAELLPRLRGEERPAVVSVAERAGVSVSFGEPTLTGAQRATAPRTQ